MNLTPAYRSRGKKKVKNLYYINQHLVSKDLLNNDWQEVKELLIQNSFPNNFIEEQIQKRNNLNSDSVKNSKDNILFSTIPYIRKKSEKFSKKLKQCSKTSE